VDIGKSKILMRNQPAYRADQAREAVLKSLAESWDEAVGLPKELRQS